MRNINLFGPHPQSQLFPQDIGYFQLDNDPKDKVEFIDGKTVYHNVFNFTARIKAEVTQGEAGPLSSANIAQTLDQYLKGKAELWYTFEINDTTYAGLKSRHELWCNKLESRFEMAPGEALRKLHTLKYRIDQICALKTRSFLCKRLSNTEHFLEPQLLCMHSCNWRTK